MAARDAADAEALASDALLAEAFDLVDAALDILAGIAWSTRGPGVLAAAAWAFAPAQARLDAAALGLVGDVDARADVVPRAQPNTAGAAFLRTALGLDRHHAARDAGTARLHRVEDRRGAEIATLADLGVRSNGMFDAWQAELLHRAAGRPV